MTKFYFEAYDHNGNLLFTGCDSSLAFSLELIGYDVKRFLDGVLI